MSSPVLIKHSSFFQSRCGVEATAANAKAVNEKLRGRDPLDTAMRPPKSLIGDARDYWKRHAPHLVEAGILTPVYADAFEVCCTQWGDMKRLHTLSQTDPKKIRAYQDGVRSWQSMARQFGLLPLESKKHNMTKAESLSDVLGKAMGAEDGSEV